MRCRVMLLALPLLVPLPAVAQQSPGVAGTYRNGPMEIVFTADGHYTVRGGETVMITGRHELRGDTITIEDQGGPYACPNAQGRYLWQRDGAALSLRLVSDACAGRVGPLTSGVWAQRFPSLVLRGATVIDGTGAPPRANVDVVIVEGKIQAVQSAGSGTVPEGAEVRDVTGRWIIPGLIDGHVHLATDPSGDDARPRVEARLRNALLGGITTVRDMAGDGRALADLARDVAAGDIPGPDIYYSALFGGPILMADPRVATSTRGVRAGTVGWARLVTPGLDWPIVIAEAKGAGATGVKLYGDIRAELLAPIVAEAHRQGLRVWSHAAVLPALPADAVAAGVDVLSHAPMLAAQAMATPPAYGERGQFDYRASVQAPALDTLLREMARRHTILEPTLWIFQGGPGKDTAAIARFGAAVTRRAYQLGVPILAGTDSMAADTPGSMPNLHHELDVLVNVAGLTAMDAIVAATATGARALGIEATTGTIAPGKVADLVVLDADPLADIRNTRRIAIVIKNGEVVQSH